MSLTRAIVVASFVLAFAAGISVGLVLVGGRARGNDSIPATAPARGGPGNPPGGRGGDRDGSFLARELSLTPAQQEQMKKIWSAVGHDAWRASDEKRRSFAKERDEEILKLIPETQRAKLEQIHEDYKRQVEDINAQRQQAFEQAKDKTLAILDEAQRKKYEEFLARRGAGRQRGPATAPAAPSAPAAAPAETP